MKATESIAWSGKTPGRAKAGETVDVSKIPTQIVQRWTRPTWGCEKCKYQGFDGPEHYCQEKVTGMGEDGLCPHEAKVTAPPVLAEVDGETGGNDNGK